MDAGGTGIDDSDMAQFYVSPVASPRSSPTGTPSVSPPDSPLLSAVSPRTSNGPSPSPRATSPPASPVVPPRLSLDITVEAEGRLCLSPDDRGRTSSTLGPSPRLSGAAVSKKKKKSSRKRGSRRERAGSSSGKKNGYFGKSADGLPQLSTSRSSEDLSSSASLTPPRVTISAGSGRSAVRFVLPAPLAEKVLAGALDLDDFRLHDMLKKVARQEFKTIAKASRLPRSWSEKLAQFPSATTFFAYSKNRYPKDVLATEETRVKLEECENDYINANYIRGSLLPGGAPLTYVACQAPLPSTMEEHWLMIWQQRSCVIVMLTKLREKSLTKAHAYWPMDPQSEELVFGRIRVACLGQKTLPGITISTLRVAWCDENGAKEAERVVYHLHYTEWPDFGVPKSTRVIRSLISYTNLYSDLGVTQGTPGPVVCHCSAGIGRTGTFIAIHLGIMLIEAGVMPDVCALVSEMRLCRAGMVQTDGQYLFVYEALNDHIKQYSEGRRPHRNISSSSLSISQLTPVDDSDCSPSPVRARSMSAANMRGMLAPPGLTVNKHYASPTLTKMTLGEDEASEDG